MNNEAAAQITRALAESSSKTQRALAEITKVLAEIRDILKEQQGGGSAER